MSKEGFFVMLLICVKVGCSFNDYARQTGYSKFQNNFMQEVNAVWRISSESGAMQGCLKEYGFMAGSVGFYSTYWQGKIYQSFVTRTLD